jgi:hypothetical protein
MRKSSPLSTKRLRARHENWLHRHKFLRSMPTISADRRGRNIHKRGYFIHRGAQMSNALAEATEARNLANVLVDQEARRTGDRRRARTNVARSLGTSPGTIENLQRNRLKRIAGWLRDALRARVIRELEAEIVRLQHEIAVLHQTGSDPRGDQMAAARADLSAVLTVLGPRH